MGFSPSEYASSIQTANYRGLLAAPFLAFPGIWALGFPSMKEASGLEIPAEMKIRFAEKLEEQVFVLPPLGEAELSDEELEGVAGGGTGFACVACTTAPESCDW